MKCSRGFSLLELLLCIALIATLASLVLPSLSGVRRSARDERIRLDLRSHAQVFAMYANDHEDAFPFFIDPQATSTVLRLRSGRVVQIRRFFSAAYHWNYALADEYYDGKEHASSFYSPDYPKGLDGSGIRAGATTYQYSCAFVAHPKYWNPSTRTLGRGQLRVTRHPDVLYPTQRTLLAPWYPFNLELPSPAGKRAGLAQPAVMVDTSAANVPLPSIMDGYPLGDGDPSLGIHLHDVPPWGMHTIDGVRGRDIIAR